MRKAYSVTALLLVVAMAVTLSASAAYAAQPAWGVRIGSQMFWDSYSTFPAPDGYPEFAGGTVYWSREVPVPYPYDTDRLVKEIYYRGHLTTSHVLVVEWINSNRNSSSVWYLPRPSGGDLITFDDMVGYHWDNGTFRLGVLCKPGTLDEAWVYVDHVVCTNYGDVTVPVYYEVPDWAGGSTPIPDPPDIPAPADPGTVPPITYPTLPDFGSTPSPGGLPEPGDGGISPLPDTPLDPPVNPDDLDPIPAPDELPDPANPVPDPDDLPDPDDPLTPDPLPEADDPLTPDPLPEADDPLTPDPLPDVDPLPGADPLPTPDPIPTLDQIPDVDPLPTIDPLSEVDPL